MVSGLLPLKDMADRHYGLTPALAGSYLEAARVSLHRNHEPPQEFLLKNGEIEQRTSVEWDVPDHRCKEAWANRDDATRDGAYACGLAATELLLGLYAVRRAETLTGADYYLARSNKPVEDLEGCLRLEVGGTQLDKSEVKRRLKQKVEQAKEGKTWVWGE
jgi:hypothetical protein